MASDQGLTRQPDRRLGEWDCKDHADPQVETTTGFRSCSAGVEGSTPSSFTMCGGTEIAQFPQGAVYENSSIEQRKTLNAAEKAVARVRIPLVLERAELYRKVSMKSCGFRCSEYSAMLLIYSLSCTKANMPVI